MHTPTSQEPLPDDDYLDEDSAEPKEVGGTQRSKLLGYSDLTRAGLGSFREYWNTLQDVEREALMRSLVEFTELSVDVNFHRVFREALSDANPRVRQLAIEGLWEDEQPDLGQRFLQMLRADDDIDVRAEAASALERFTGLLEADGNTGTDEARSLVVTFVSICSDPEENVLVRRRCIEAAGPLARDFRVEQMIREMYADGDQALAAGALRAMGLSRQSRWIPEIERAMISDDAELRFAATGAAGASGEDHFVEGLARLLDDEDGEVRFAAITALGQIGGAAAVRMLGNLRERGDVEDDELIQEALDEAMLSLNPLAN